MEGPEIFAIEQEGSSMKFGVSMDDEDHQFEAWVTSKDDHRRGMVEYQETLSWRGAVRVSNPDDAVWKALLSSEEVREWREKHDVQTIRRYDG